MKSENSISKINSEEVIRFQEQKKTEIFTTLDSNWKMTIKQQIENELNQKVRDALDTPPLERIRRHQQEALLRKSEQDNYKTKLNSHIKFDSKEKYNVSHNSLSTNNCLNHNEKEPEILSYNIYNDETHLNGYNKFEYWLKPKYEPQKLNSTNILIKLTGNNLEKKIIKTGIDAGDNFGSLSRKEKELLFSTFTKEGFLEFLKTGKLPDGNKLVSLHDDTYKDVFGVIRDKDGPFWPKDIGPLYPTPHHKRINSEKEPLFDSIKEKEENSQGLNDKQYTAMWKHVQIIYDSETSVRDQKPFQYADNVCPNLIFESRFESGNLRQVRRTGQFEYELVLNNDLYTNRHTQWFYFRIENMKKDVTYKFVLINLLKSTSLYMQGMRILRYSENSAKRYNIGWHRTGHHIRYSRNCTRLQCPLLSRDVAYYQLEFQMEFLHSEDTCYLSHCYPYTYTDLKTDLKHFLINFQTKPFIQKEILCQTNIGNSCFVLTITDKNFPDNEKLGVVITARVHPGEANSSWMMNGLIQYLTGESEIAKNLRQRVLFKLVPMLNPDGVIVGNYRCSMAGRDLNRNYRFPKEQSFPTVYYTKKLVESLKNQCIDIALYCDLHGHSRKHNVFMYGCDSQYLNSEDVSNVNPVLNVDTVETYIKDRIFPFLMQKNGPELFSFSGCHFKIHKCKESTGRVVMWKQFNIDNSYTLETAFSGTDLNIRRHFNVADLEEIGKILSESLQSYIELKADEKKTNEVGLELLKIVLKQLTTKNKRINQLFQKLALQKTDMNDSETKPMNETSESLTLDSENEKHQMNIEHFIDSLQIDDVRKLRNFNFEISEIEDDSTSSDSNSESEPEEVNGIEQKVTMKSKKKRKKIKTQMKDLKEVSAKKPADQKSNTKNLPLVNKVDKLTSNSEKKAIERIFNHKVSSKVPSLRKLPLFLSKYKGRSNGGIPCFTEERVLERATRKSLTIAKRDLDESLFKIDFDNDNERHSQNDFSENKLMSFLKSTDNLAEQYSKLQWQSDQILQYRSNQYNQIDQNPESMEERIIQKPTLDYKQIKEISKIKVNKPTIFKKENGESLKSIFSDVPIVTVKETTITKKFP